MKQFEAEIKQKEGMDASYIEIPFDIEEVYGSKRVKVKATFDGHPYRGSIVRMGLPCYMIGITKEVRNAIGKTFGDKIQVTIEKDEEERVLELPKELEKALEEEQEIKSYWEGLSFSMKKKFCTSILTAKKEKTRKNRIEIVLEKLRNKEKM